MTINLTREDFEQAIKSGASVFEGNTIPDTGKPSGRYYRFIRGRDAVTDFIGTDISSSEFSRVLDETEMVMPDETFEKFWEKYI